MENLINLWTGLALRKRILAVASLAAILGTFFVMAQIAARPNMTLLYANLDDAAAQEVLASLQQQNVPHELRGAAVYVPADQRDATRLALAGEGLPRSGPQGYELLDSLTGFGTTSQMFDAAYWRAKEGELARTILSSPHVKEARVHISNANSGGFQRNQTRSASVFLKGTTGQISPDLAQSLRYLVASAVEGLAPDSVSVIDGNGRLVASVAEVGSATSADRSTALRDRVQRLIEARVGPGNAVVEVSIETALEREAITERRFDPEGRVAISTDTEERTQDSSGSAGALTVASNLPDGEAAGAADSRNQNNETRERVNYEVSETTREILRSPGAIKRITVAVLVNDLETVDEAGAAVITPRPDAELEALSALVASAVGYDASRGDEITIKSMPFEALLAAGTTGVPAPWLRDVLDLNAALKLGILALVTAILGLFVLRPILRNSAPDPLPALELAPSTDAEDAIDAQSTGRMNALPQATDLVEDTADNTDPVERLRSLIDARRDETVEVLRDWLDEAEEVT